MVGITAILIASVVGVDYGLVEDPDRGSTYVIQIEPELAQQLVEGFVIESVIPPELKGIRRFRIQVGDEDLPKPPIPVDDKNAIDDESEDPSATDLTEQASVDSTDKDAFPLNAPVEPEQEDLDSFPVILEENSEEVPPPSIIPDETVVPMRGSGAVAIAAPSLDPQAIDLPVLGEHEEPLVAKDAPPRVDGSPQIPEFDAPNVQEIDALPTPAAIPAEDLIKKLDPPSPVILPIGEVEPAKGVSQIAAESGSVEPALLEQKDTGFVQLASSATPAPVKSDGTAEGHTAVSAAAKRSWPMFTAVVLGLLLSLGGNVYLAMTLMGLYRKLKTTSLGG
ncbi:MAG: hypothetical protein VX738_14905 [Planctomycetota bacterium]|nr:hypothetical protein [Planctomycetota bacterium]